MASYATCDKLGFSRKSGLSVLTEIISTYSLLLTCLFLRSTDGSLQYSGSERECSVKNKWEKHADWHE